MVNKDEAVLKWASENPYLTDRLLMGFLRENRGACAIVPIAGAAVVTSYVDGSKVMAYDFMLQVMQVLSDTTDNVNVDNMHSQRLWQEWIERMEEEGNYPDFGEGCGSYELVNLSNMPQMAQCYDNGMAKYQFPARIVYRQTL